MDLDYRPGVRPELERHLTGATADCCDDEEHLQGIMQFCKALDQRADDQLDQLRFGGTEEQILCRG